MYIILFFFFNDTATTEIYTLSLHDALPISFLSVPVLYAAPGARGKPIGVINLTDRVGGDARSEEHTSELQSRLHLVCRLLLEKKNRAGMSNQTSAVLRRLSPQ